MIKSKKGTVICKGDVAEIPADLTIMLKAVRKLFAETLGDVEKADRVIERALKLSKLSEEEIEAEHLAAMLKRAADEGYVRVHFDECGKEHGKENGECPYFAKKGDDNE